jgi:hypothetical protein
MNRIANFSLSLALAVLPCVAQQSNGPEVLVNGRALTPPQIQALQASTGTPPQPGCYWYDPRSGFYGFCGRETAGVVKPGAYEFGEVAADASQGNTGVFLNGRELNAIEKVFFERLFGSIPPGRWWLDGSTGNIGREGSPIAQANLVAAIQQAQRRSKDGDNVYRYRDGHGTTGFSDGNCTSMSVPGSDTVMSPGCN